MDLQAVIEKSREIRGEAFQILKECYKNSSNKEFLKLQFKLCEEKLKIIADLFENDCNSGPAKSSCYYTSNQLVSIRETLFSLINITGASVTPHVQWFELENIFKNSIKLGMLKNYGFLDVEDFLNACKVIFFEQIKLLKTSVKVNTTFDALFSLIKSDEVLEENKSFVTKTFEIFAYSKINELFDENIRDQLLQMIEEFQERDSGWTLKEINYLNVNIFNFNPLRAGSYIELPKAIQNKKACINIKNEDQMCFKWAVLCGLYHERYRGEDGKLPNIKNAERLSKYVAFEGECGIDFSNLNYPTSPLEIEKFEIRNQISIHLFAIEVDENSEKMKVIVAQPSVIGKKKGRTHLNLLLLQKVEQLYDIVNVGTDFQDKNVTKKRKSLVLKSEYNNHYLYIKNVERLVGRQVTNVKKFFCEICFHYFHKKDDLEHHEEKCRETNDCEVVLPDEDNDEGRVLKFTNFGNKIPVPFAIYADFESLLTPVEGDPRKEILHEPLSVGYHYKCR